MLVTNNKFQNLCKWAAKPNINKNINLYTPVVQSAFVSSIYIYDIKKSDMPEKTKRGMLIHDVLCMFTGILTSVWLTRGIDKFKNNVIKHLEGKKTIEKVGGVCRGFEILAPILITSAIMRYIVPVGAISVSDYINKYQKKGDKK